MCRASCALDAVRMVWDRCPTVERVEFVGCGGEGEAFLENDAGGVVEFERVESVDVDAVGACCVGEEGRAVGSLWWEGSRGFGDKIDACIRGTEERLERMMVEEASVSKEGGEDEEVVVDEFVPVLVPAGFRKCIVIQGDSLDGFRDKFYIHAKTRLQNVWGHAV
ncbi:hypothetical protein HDU98_009521 [Podochytrium sp. JEL0797]|nr:hypothetical protein HDU98_009521 [Podochytrium sp. JEL0797]